MGGSAGLISLEGLSAPGAPGLSGVLLAMMLLKDVTNDGDKRVAGQ
jgi:hypothetical protein